MNEKISWFNNLSKKNRIATVLSALWLMIITMYVIDASNSYYQPSAGELFGRFLLLGILPVFLYWSWRWIKSSKD